MKLINLSRQISSEECFAVAKKKMKMDRNISGYKLLDIIVDRESADKLLKAHKNPGRKLTSEEALGLIVDGRLTKANYKLIRETAKKTGHNIYPVYEEVYKINKNFNKM